MKHIKKLLIVLMALILVGCSNQNFINRDAPFANAGNQTFDIGSDLRDLLNDKQVGFYQYDENNLLFDIDAAYYTYNIATKEIQAIAIDFNQLGKPVYVDPDNHSVIYYDYNGDLVLSDFSGTAALKLQNEPAAFYYEGYIISPHLNSDGTYYTNVFDLGLNLVVKLDNIESFLAGNSLNDDYTLVCFDNQTSKLYSFRDGNLDLLSDDIRGKIGKTIYIDERMVFFTKEGDVDYLYYYYKGIKLLPEIDDATTVNFVSEDGDFLIHTGDNQYYMYNTVASQVARRTLPEGQKLFDAVGSYYIQTSDNTFVHYSLFGIKLKTYYLPEGSYGLFSMEYIEGQPLFTTTDLSDSSHDEKIFWLDDGFVVEVAKYFYNNQSDTITITSSDYKNVQIYQNMKQVFDFDNQDMAAGRTTVQNRNIITYYPDGTCKLYDLKGDFQADGVIIANRDQLFRDNLLIAYAKHLISVDFDDQIAGYEVYLY